MSEDPSQDVSPESEHGPAAAVEYDVELRPRGRTRTSRALRVVAAVGAGLFQGLLPVPSTSDLVVVRRRDGAEVSRTPAGDAPGLLEHVRTAAREQSAERFLRAWGPAAPDR